jgi:hypothetical protein
MASSPIGLPFSMISSVIGRPTTITSMSISCARACRANGAARTGNARWRRLTEERASGAKSVFHFDVQGSVAKSTHAGIPWLRFIRRRLGDRVWPSVIIGSALEQAPAAERPVALPPEVREPFVMPLPPSPPSLPFSPPSLPFSPPPPPSVQCGKMTVVLVPVREGQRVFVVQCPVCKRTGTYSLDYGA